MAWYDTGTVSVTNGSTAVTGSGTNFVAGAQVGEGFYGPDGRLYEIQAIVSATSLTLADAYLGTTQTGQQYKIVPTQSLVADLASQVSTLISDYQSVADNAGEGKFQDGSATSPGITFTLDQDTGFFRDTANEIGVAVAGVKKAEFNSSGMQFEDNSKAIFGAGSDLQIYHTGAHSYIDDQGTGNLYLNSNGSGTIIQGGGTQARFFNGAGVDLWYNNAIKLATTSTGVDVTGTVTADALTVSNSSANADIVLTEGGTNTDARIRNSNGILQIGSDINNEFGASEIQFSVDGKEFLTVDRTGDISFYEDTGTTAKFFWDASAESLGIGTTSPAYPLDMKTAGLTQARFESTGTSGSYVQFRDADTTSGQSAWIGSDGDLFKFYSNNNTLNMTMTTAGNVGIGTSSPQSDLEIQSKTTGTDAVISLTAAGTRRYQIKALTSVGALAFVDESLASERMRITSTGLVGIGTSSPEARLAVRQSALNEVALVLPMAAAAADGNYSSIRGKYAVGNEFCRSEVRFGIQSGAAGTGFLAFATGTSTASERMRLDSSGRLLVGQTAVSTGARIEVTYTGGVTEYGIALRASQDTTSAILFSNAAGATVGSITQTASATAYNTSSDYRLKEDVQPMTGASERVLALNPVNFAWKSDGTRTDGFLAHEAQAVVPDAVHGEKDAVDADGKPVYQGIDQSKLVPLLTAALQEALGRIETLEAEVAALKA